ncbi:intraflagellar transport protein 81 homolog [Trichonephila clavipes]|nr:intraflagellar transport protein 81 homolog [Trichonephila clavipes]
MSEQIKFIIQELNKEPYNKKFNLISFDSLRTDNLLQIVNDVFAEVDPKMKMDVRAEDPEQMVLKSLNFLKVLKYKPPETMDLSDFRQGLVTGEKSVIYHILEWILRRTPELKKRAYLAQFLMKIELPPDIEGDADIMELYEQYENVIEEFKEVHKQFEALKSSGFSTQEIRKDLEHMEEERDQLIKKIDRLKMKVESHPNVEAMLSVAKNLREERDLSENLNRQKMEQRNALTHAEQKIQRLNQQLKELKLSSLGATPETLVQKLEESIKVNSYLVKEKLPKEIATQKKYITDLQKIISQPALSRADLDQINNKIQEVNNEIHDFIENRMRNNNPIDDKLSLFRQQVSILAHKKERAAEELNAARAQLSELQTQLEAKKIDNKTGEGEFLKGDEFKRYVNKLRGKSNIYKKKRQEMAELKTECGILSRTVDILQQKEAALSKTLAQLEMQKGVSGFHSAQDELEKVSSMKAELDERKGQTLEEMSVMVQKLNIKIAEKKARLAPVIKELRPLRQQCQDMSFEYEQKKQAYDSCALGLESNISKIEQEVNAYKEEITEAEHLYHTLNVKIQMLEKQNERVAEEIKSYVSSDAADKKKSIREQYNKNIQEQEAKTKILRELQKEVKDNQAYNEKQMQMWSNLQKLLECKKKCQEEENRSNKVKSGHRPFSPLTLLQHIEFTPALTFFPTCSDFWLDFPPVVRMACKIKLLESEATTGFFVLLGEQGNKAVLDWVMKEGLIPSRYECPKCKKGIRLVERKGTIDGFEWLCRVQSKENPYFVCRSVRKGKELTEWCMKEGLIASSYECPKCNEKMGLYKWKSVVLEGFEWICRKKGANTHAVRNHTSHAESMSDHYLAEYIWRRSHAYLLSDETFKAF